MNNTATITAEDHMDNIIDAWHAAGRPGFIADFPGYIEARDAYLAERWGA